MNSPPGAQGNSSQTVLNIPAANTEIGYMEQHISSSLNTIQQLGRRTAKPMRAANTARTTKQHAERV